MSDPSVLVQLSDPHIGADWVPGVDPVARLAAAVEAVAALSPRPGAVLVSGDLTDHATAAEYEQARALLEPLDAPVHVLPGNHDDRAGLRRHFGLPGAGDDPVQYAVDLGPMRLVVVDTTIPGDDPGALGADGLAWLDAELAAAPAAPTLVAMHHTPLVTGVPMWDAFGLRAADRRALGDVVARHPQVRRLSGGHVHRVIAADLGGRAVMSAPSTYVQARLNLGADEFEPGPDPPGFVVHALVDGELASHVQPIGQASPTSSG